MVTALPAPDMDSMPWWGYAILMGSLTLLGAAVWALRSFFRHYVIDTVPQGTVDLITRAKDAEIERARIYADEWRTAFHVKDAAYMELAKSLDDLTDALAAGNLRPDDTRTEAQGNGRSPSRPARRQ